MSLIYRAYSPTRDKAGAPFADHAHAVSQAAVRNQFALTDDSTADWIVQQGVVSWDEGKR